MRRAQCCHFGARFELGASATSIRDEHGLEAPPWVLEAAEQTQEAAAKVLVHVRVDDGIHKRVEERQELEDRM